MRRAPYASSVISLPNLSLLVLLSLSVQDSRPPGFKPPTSSSATAGTVSTLVPGALPEDATAASRALWQAACAAARMRQRM